MINIILKSTIFALLIILLTNFVNSTFYISSYLSDVGSLSVFASIFGSLFGILTAFIVFEVWNQYNKISSLIGQEALGLEGLYRLTLNLEDKKIAENIKKAINNYCNLQIENKFKMLGEGERNPKVSLAFRQIANQIREFKIKNSFDEIVFNHLVTHFELLSKTRTQRVDESLTRLPGILKVFLYTASSFALILVIFLPFSNLNYSLLTAGILSFSICMILLIVEDLDNPFKGYWKLTPEPYVRSLKHIEEDYK